MKIGLVGRSGITAFLLFACLSLPVQIRAQFTPVPAGSAFSIPEAQLLKPEALVQLLQTTNKDKPLILRLLSLESLSEPRASVRKTARDGICQREGPLSRQQLRRGLGRQGLPG